MHNDVTMKTIKAFTLAATKSGAGKTTMTIGILAALIRRGIAVQPFKCGPDYIDPTLHKAITNRTSYNLDLKMMGIQACQRTFYEHAVSADLSLVEGVMGLFDGGSASTASLAKRLKIPVILVIDAQSCAQSAVAVLEGFQNYDPDVHIAGVIFNRIGSERHKDLIEEEVLKKSSVPVIGFMPRDINFTIPERHLGLHMGDENPLSGATLGALADSIEKNLRIDLMLSCESKSNGPCLEKINIPTRHPVPAKIEIGVASDEAFCFYYKENFEIFERAGFKLRTFSPLYDHEIPRQCKFIYLGGGYPELFARELSQNRAMLESLREKHDQGATIYSECGGFMYLCDKLVDMNDSVYPMAGLFPFKALMNKRLRKLGYRSVRLLQRSFLGEEGTRLYGHEFHYSHMVESDRENQAGTIARLYELDNNSCEGYYSGSAIGSYIHLHFGRNPGIADFMYDYFTSNS